MICRMYSDTPESSSYYISYYDDKSYENITAILKIDEDNLRKIAKDIGIDYIQMSKSSNIDTKINEIQNEIKNSENKEDKKSTYQDIYYYFAIPLVIVLVADFIIQKRRM